MARKARVGLLLSWVCSASCATYGAPATWERARVGANREPPHQAEAQRVSATSDARATAPPQPLAAMGAPAAQPDAAPKHVVEPGVADADPDNDYVVAPPDVIPDCEARLDAAGIKWKRAELPVKERHGSSFSCGTEQAVVYVRGPERIRLNVAPVMSCGLALAFAHFEHVLNDEAQRTFGKRVVRMEQVGTYACREMARFRGNVSEHAYANAIDIASFTLENGKRIRVYPDFEPVSREAQREPGRFLRHLANRLFDDGVFSNVVTPFYDDLHKTHLHFDLARYRVDGTR